VTGPKPEPDSPPVPGAGSTPAATRQRDPNLKKGAPWIKKGIADADKKARTGSTAEPVRTTPPAGAWNETSSD
jgi:hypothetical protein